MSWAPTNEEFSARIAEYNRAQARSATSPSSAKILHLPPNGAESPPANDDFTLTLQDFVAYMPMHNYVCLPTREFWPAASVNSRIAPVTDGKKSVTAGAWLDAGYMGAGKADADIRQGDLGWRMDRSAKVHGIKPLPTADHRAQARQCRSVG
jgi:hypothetical protein